MARLCQYIKQPGGCRKGKNCNYSHQQPGRDSNARPPPAQNVEKVWVPNGTCRDDYTSGECSRGFACKFKHQARAGQASSSAAVPRSAPQQIAVYAHGNVYARHSDDILQPARWRTPDEVRDILNKIKADGYHFETPTAILVFNEALLAINKNNPSWTDEDRATFLTALTEPPGQGLIRFSEIVKYTPISYTAPSLSRSLPFVQGYLALLAFLTSEHVVNSPVNREVNASYRAVDNNLDRFAPAISVAIQHLDSGDVAAMLAGGSSRSRLHSPYQIHKIITLFMAQFVARNKDICAMREELPPLMGILHDSFQRWSQQALTSGDAGNDPISTVPLESRHKFVGTLAEEISKLVYIRDRDLHRLPASQGGIQSAADQEAFVLPYNQIYRPPGQNRHDNDRSSIAEITIEPSHSELMAKEIYLPLNVASATHQLPSDSMDRFVDIQFRLFREEMIGPLREGLQSVMVDLAAPKTVNTSLNKLLSSGGGIYRQKGCFLPIFSQVRFYSLQLTRSGFAIGILVTAHNSGRARSAEYWRSKNGLDRGALVAIIVDRKRIFSGTVVSAAADIAKNAGNGRAVVDIVFNDAIVDVMAVRAIKDGQNNEMILVKSDILMDSVKPYLSVLQSVEPVSIPFSRCLVHGARLSSIDIEVPKYARHTSFNWSVKSILKTEANKENAAAAFSPLDTDEIAASRELLHQGSILDPSQTDALLNILTSEIALVQGPPGTGKSFTGLQLLRVLLDNKVGPIMLIAYTNHALDTLLSHVVGNDLKKKIVRLGGQSKHESIQPYSLFALEEAHRAAGGKHSRTIKTYHWEQHQAEDEMRVISKRMHNKSVHTLGLW